MTAMKLKMCNPSKVKCPCMTLFEQLERSLNTKQQEEEAPIECTKRFEQAQDNMKSIVRTEWLHQFVESTEQCINKTNGDVQDKLKENSASHLWYMHFKKL